MALENRTPPVPTGVGFFHTPKVKYSNETRNLLKELMEESRVANQYRRAVNRILDRGGELPSPEDLPAPKRLPLPLPIPPIMMIPRRRSKEAIVNSGAYQPEKAPPGPTVHLSAKNSYLTFRELEKERLTSLMAFGKEVPATPRKLWNRGAAACRAANILKPPASDGDEATTLNSLDRLQMEMTDRMRFLKDVATLARRDKKLMQAANQVAKQVADQIREMKQLNRSEGEQIANEIGPILETFGLER